jgi:dipeptidase
MNMKKKLKCVRGFGAAVALVALGVLWVAVPCRACFSIVVGKDASADGCVMVGHNEDDGAPQIVNHHKVPRQRYPSGATVTLRNGGVLAQAEQTWAYIWSEMPEMLYSDSYVNEWGVTVTSDNCPSREDRPEITDGGIGCMLRRLVAQRARTAREGVRLAGQLVERFGYIDSGRTYIIADPNEGWLCCVVNGKRWMARRVPDDQVAMVANTYTIRKVDLKDSDSFLACGDIIDYARERGWYGGKADGSFDFAAVYANPASASHSGNFGRQWSGLMYVTGQSLELRPELPFSVRPQRKLGVADVMRILRHDKEAAPGSAFCDIDVINEQGCALCSAKTQTSFVARPRNDIPRDVGIVYWVCLAAPRTSFYMPFHFGISSFPAGFRHASERPTEMFYEDKVQAPFAPDALEAFWVFSNFREKVEDADAATIAKIKAEAQSVEREALVLQEPLEETARKMYRMDPAAAARLMENYAKGVYLSCLEAMSAILAGK